jgi:hypothetical protein
MPKRDLLTKICDAALWLIEQTPRMKLQRDIEKREALIERLERVAPKLGDREFRRALRKRGGIYR